MTGCHENPHAAFYGLQEDGDSVRVGQLDGPAGPPTVRDNRLEGKAALDEEEGGHFLDELLVGPTLGKGCAFQLCPLPGRPPVGTAGHVRTAQVCIVKRGHGKVDAPGAEALKVGVLEGRARGVAEGDVTALQRCAGKVCKNKVATAHVLGFEDHLARCQPAQNQGRALNLKRVYLVVIGHAGPSILAGNYKPC